MCCILFVYDLCAVVLVVVGPDEQRQWGLVCRLANELDLEYNTIYLFSFVVVIIVESWESVNPIRFSGLVLPKALYCLCLQASSSIGMIGVWGVVSCFFI